MMSKNLQLFLILTLFIASCGGKKEVDTGVDSNEIVESNIEKESIKAFWGYYRQAQKYRVGGEWAMAAEYYTKALEVNEEHEDALFNLGNMYLELQQYSEAEHCWKKVVEIYPNSARAHMQLGRLYLSYERPEIFNLDKAEAEFTTTSEINKVVTGLLMLLGHVYLLRADYEQAGLFFSSIIGSDTKNVEAHFLLGYVAWKGHNSSRAMDLLGKAVEYSAPEQAIGGVLSEGDTQEGISYLRPINESMFHDFFIDLHDEKGYELSNLMDDLYTGLNDQLSEIRKLVL